MVARATERAVFFLLISLSLRETSIGVPRALLRARRPLRGEYIPSNWLIYRRRIFSHRSRSVVRDAPPSPSQYAAIEGDATRRCIRTPRTKRGLNQGEVRAVWVPGMGGSPQEGHYTPLINDRDRIGGYSGSCFFPRWRRLSCFLCIDARKRALTSCCLFLFVSAFFLFLFADVPLWPVPARLGASRLRRERLRVPRSSRERIFLTVTTRPCVDLWPSGNKRDNDASYRRCKCF